MRQMADKRVSHKEVREIRRWPRELSSLWCIPKTCPGPERCASLGVSVSWSRYRNSTSKPRGSSKIGFGTFGWRSKLISHRLRKLIWLEQKSSFGDETSPRTPDAFKRPINHAELSGTQPWSGGCVSNLEVAMRTWPVIWIALISPAAASPLVSPEDAEIMRLEALADRAPERIHGRFDFLLEDPDVAVDTTTGQATSVDDDCSRVPIKVRRSDGQVVTERVDVCD
jgi:hypothetical protein